VSKTEGTDRNNVSTGCAVVYIYWLQWLGYSTKQIVEAGGATLAANYQTLTGKTTAYADLIAALQGLTVNSDNPFPVNSLGFIKTNNTPNGHVEVHIASRASNYQTRTLETATTFANESDGVWSLVS
jgi:hypothetical protein